MILSIKKSTEHGTHHCKSQGREFESNKENRLTVAPLECVSTHLNAKYMASRHMTSQTRHSTSFDVMCLLGHNRSLWCLVLTVVNTYSNVRVLGK